MKRPEIIEGEPFDWYVGGHAAKNSVDADGNVNWKAAFYADPGVLSCPFCDESMWREGIVVKCPTCQQQFNTNWRDVARKATGKDPVVARIRNKTNENLVKILHDVYDSVTEGKPVNLPQNGPPLISKFVQFIQTKTDRSSKILELIDEEVSSMYKYYGGYTDAVAEGASKRAISELSDRIKARINN